MCFNGFLKYSQSMAIYYFENQNFSNAIPYFKKIIDYYPMKIGKYHAYLGVCYLNVGDFDNSMKHYQIAKQIIPNDKNILQLEALLKRKKN